jgi:probable phosphoglycerate mutase
VISRVYLVRHGETAWSKSGRHTGRTEISLSEQGEVNARYLAPWLASVRFSGVFVSPRVRAQQTCELAGLGGAAQPDTELAEWDYGDFEGLSSAEIQGRHPGWNLFTDGCPGGESPAQVSGRADRVIARVRSLDGNVALFSHGHFGRVLAARWAGFPVEAGERLQLDTASVGIFAYEHANPAAPVISLWNVRPSDGAGAPS